MKVILQHDVPNLGKAGDMHEVSPGYFRNFLQPRGLATEATKGRVHSQQVRAGQVKDRATRERDVAQARAQQLSALRLRLPVKVGEQGRMYGSVTARDIAEELAKHGTTVDRHKITLTEPLRSLGVHTVTLRLEHGVEAQIGVELVSEDES